MAGIITFGKGDQGWCPHCELSFPLIKFDRVGRPLCFLCGLGRDDDLIQLDQNTFRCRFCGMRFGVSVKKTPKCLNPHCSGKTDRPVLRL